MERIGHRSPDIVRKTSRHGAYMSVARTPITFEPTGETADHEAAHVVAARRIRYSTIIRQGDALGTTAPVELTPAAAAGAAALGHRGTGWDELITVFYLGVPFSRAKAEASAALAGKDLERAAVAGALERKRTIFQADVDEAYRQADKARRGVATVEVLIFDIKGRKTHSEHETTQSAEEVLSDVEFDLELRELLDSEKKKELAYV